MSYDSDFCDYGMQAIYFDLYISMGNQQNNVKPTIAVGLVQLFRK